MERRTESSVLTSLRDLKHIEKDRRERDEAARRARRQAAQRAKQEASRSAREEIEARERARERAERKAMEGRRREEHEARLRLAQAEARARIEAETELELERLRLASDGADAGGKTVRHLVLGIVAVVLMLSLGLGYVLGVYLPEQRRASEASASARLKGVQERMESDRKLLQSRLIEREEAIEKARQSGLAMKELAALRAELETLRQARKGSPMRPGAMAAGRMGTRAVRGDRTQPGRETGLRKPDPSIRNNPLRGIFEDDDRR